MAKWTASDLPDLTGRSAIVTGASGGLGLVTARELARAGAKVVLAVRNVEKGKKVAAGLAGSTEVRNLDVASLGSIHRFVEEWPGTVDILINNAGIMEVPLARTVDGFETQMATNYFGPFALTNLLLPRITDRVVFVSSQLHRQSRLDLDDLDFRRRPYKPLPAYNDSKLAIVLYALELQRRLSATGSSVRSIVAHPGIASTNLAMHSTSGRITHALRFLFNDVEHGALPILYAASQDVPGGSYIGPDGFNAFRGYPAIGKPSRAAEDPTTARRLWAITADLIETDHRPVR